MPSFSSLVRLSSNPFVLLVSVGAGILLGLYLPDAAKATTPFGEAYLGLLKMIILPFLLSSVMLGFARILRENALVRILPRIASVFLVAMVLAAGSGIGLALALGTGSGLSQEAQASMGRVVGGDGKLQVADELEVSMDAVETSDEPDPWGRILIKLIPENVFQALSEGETLKVLAFSLLFGLAVGRTRGGHVESLLSALQVVFDACQKVMRWTNVLLPLALCSMVGVQVSQAGAGSMGIMGQFILLNVAVTALLWLVAWAVLARRGAVGWSGTFAALQEPLLIAAGTRNSLASIPSAIEALVERFRFPQELVVLLMPLGVTLCRLGPVSFFGLSGVFIAQMYGIALSPFDLLVLLGGSIAVGIASAGTSGVLTLSMIALVCRPLSLPTEAAVVLFLAVDVVNGVLRSATNVLGTAAMIAAVCDPVPRHAKPAEVTA